MEPLAAERPETLASLAHGAGRKYDRASMHGRAGATKSDRARLARNPFGGLVVCEDRDLLVEEAPEAYKSIDRIVADLVEFGLARVVATFRPLVTYKTAGSGTAQRRRPPRPGGSPMTRLLLTSGRGPAECRIALAHALKAMAREAEAAGLGARRRRRSGPGRAGSGLGRRRGDPGRGRRGLRPELDRLGAVDGAKPGPAPSQAQELVHRRDGAGGARWRAPRRSIRPKCGSRRSAREVRAASIRTPPTAPSGRSHRPSGLTVVVRNERSQHRNKALALERLAELLRLGAELEAITDRQRTQANHDRLERGRPVRRFKGEDFRPA